MICKKCGSPMDDDAKFCDNCGAHADTSNDTENTAKAVLDETAGIAGEQLSKSREEADKALSDMNKKDSISSADAAIAAIDNILEKSGVNVSEIEQEAPSIQQPGYVPPQPQYNAPPMDAPAFDPPPAPVYAPAPDPEPAPKEEEYAAETPVKVGAGRLIGAGFITILALLLMIILSLMFCMKLGISGDIVRKRIENMSFATAVDGDMQGKTLYDDMYGALAFSDITQGKANRSEFREYLLRTDMLAFAGKKAGQYVDYMMIGDMADPSVTASEITEVFENASGADEDVFGYSLQSSDYNKLRRQIEKNNLEDDLSIELWSKKAGFSLDNLNYMFSYITLGVILALVLVLLIWIAVIVDKRGKHLLGFYGNIFKWSGALVFIIGAVIIAGGGIAYLITGQAVFYIVPQVLLPFALFALCIGALEFFIGWLFRRIKTAIRRKEKRNKAVEKALAQVHA